MTGILFAVLAAVMWGSGDFSGGFASRKINQFQVLAISASSGLFVLLIAALLWHETFPPINGIMWGVLAGMSGVVGISSLYRGISIGNIATVAPTSAVIGAALPVLFSLITRGLPRYLQLIGFLLAFLGIWLVSRSTGDATSNSRKGFLLGILAGFGFGGFFILISQVGTEKVFTPLIISRSVMFVTSLFLIKVNHMSFPSIIKTPVALLAGVLDAGGNILFMLAKQLTRLDTAVVISSLYPAGTVILAGILLKEKISTWQKIGVVICLIAIVLITI